VQGNGNKGEAHQAALAPRFRHTYFVEPSTVACAAPRPQRRAPSCEVQATAAAAAAAAAAQEDACAAGGSARGGKGGGKVDRAPREDSGAVLASAAVRQRARQRARQLKQDWKRTAAGRTVTKVRYKATRSIARVCTVITQGGSY